MKLSKCCKVEIIKTLSGANICPSCGQPCTEQPEPADLKEVLIKEIKTLFKMVKVMNPQSEAELIAVSLPNLHIRVFELIAKAKKEGVEEERERIVNIIETEITLENQSGATNRNAKRCVYLNELLNLIN